MKIEVPVANSGYLKLEILQMAPVEFWIPLISVT